MENFSLGAGLFAGVVMALLGAGFYAAAVVEWSQTAFGDLNPQRVLRIIILGTFFIIVGLELFFWSFIISLMGFRTER
jgi:hypothetical protein